MKKQPVGTFEFKVNGEYDYYYIVKNEKKLSFGTVSNNGFTEHGYLKLDDYFSLGEHLQWLCKEVKEYFKNGKEPLKTIIHELEG